MRAPSAPLAMIDHQAFEARLEAAELPKLDGIVAEAEKVLPLPKGYRRPAIDNRDDALYALRLACHVAGCTYFNDAHPWNRVEVIDAIRAAETRKLRPFIRRMARIAFGSRMRDLCMPPGTFKLTVKLLDEENDAAPKSELAAAVASEPADDDAHPLGRLDALRRSFDGQVPALQAQVIEFVRLAYGSVPAWMTVREAKKRGGARTGAGRPAGARQARKRVTRTADEKRREGVKRFNRWKLDRLYGDGGVLEPQLTGLPPDAPDADDDLLNLIGAGTTGAVVELELEWKRITHTTPMRLYAAWIASRLPLPVLTPETSPNVRPRPFRPRLCEI